MHNLSGGTITGGQLGIITNSGATLDVTNFFGGTISGGTAGIEGSGIVRNAGTISGGTVNFTGTGTNTLILQTGSELIGNAMGSAAAARTTISSFRAAAPPTTIS